MGVFDEIAEEYTYNGVISMKALEDDIVTLENQIDSYDATLKELALRRKNPAALKNKIREAKIRLSLLKALYKKESEQVVSDDKILDILGISGKNAKETEIPTTAASKKEPLPQDFQKSEIEVTEDYTEVKTVTGVDGCDEKGVVVEDEPITPDKPDVVIESGDKTEKLFCTMIKEKSQESDGEVVSGTDIIDVEGNAGPSIEHEASPGDLNTCIGENNSDNFTDIETVPSSPETPSDEKSKGPSPEPTNEEEIKINQEVTEDEVNEIKAEDIKTEEGGSDFIANIQKIPNEEEAGCTENILKPGTEDETEALGRCPNIEEECGNEAPQMTEPDIEPETGTTADFLRWARRFENFADDDNELKPEYPLEEPVFEDIPYVPETEADFSNNSDLSTVYNAFPDEKRSIMSIIDFSQFTKANIETENLYPYFDIKGKTLTLRFDDIRDYGVFVGFVKERTENIWGWFKRLLKKPRNIFMIVTIKTDNLSRVYRYDFNNCEIYEVLDTDYPSVFSKNCDKHNCSVTFKYKKLVIKEIEWHNQYQDEKQEK